MNIKMENKEIQKDIKKLKKLKKQLRVGTKERLKINQEIRNLKIKLVDYTILEPLKEPIIADILRIEAERKTTPTFEQLGINLQGYTLEQLKTHLKKLTQKREV
jgi:hypothetical protein